MNTITIGTDTRSLDFVDPDWITQQINGRRRDGQAVCVRVSIHSDGINLSRATPGCMSSGGSGGGRLPTDREREIFDLWAKHGLDDNNFSPGSVIAFVKQVLRLI